MGLPALGVQRGVDGGLKVDGGMLRTVNLAAGLVGLALLVVGLFGGLGSLIGFSYFGESLIDLHPWLGRLWTPIVVAWGMGWLGGLVMLALRFPHLLRRIRTRSAESWALSDVPLVLGHVCSVAALACILLPASWSDFFYFGFMWAGFFYAVGVAGFALFFAE